MITARLARYLTLVFVLMVSLHFILSSTHDQYRESVTRFSSHFQEELFGEDLSAEDPSIPVVTTDPSTVTPQPVSSFPTGPANATFVMLVRNSDLDGTISSIRAMEDRFNSKYGYPWVLLNDQPFTEEFKRRVSVLTPSKVQFGIVPPEHWSQPDWIDEEKASRARKQMAAANVKYGDSVAYRNMCRFNSGFFYQHELLQQYRWYWRVEPNVKFYCDILHDPFRFMEANNKTYGFTIMVYEIPATISSLWKTVREFMNDHPEHIAQDNALGFISDNGGTTYNRCHFWSNFEIADMDFWRGPAYSAFFDYLDKKGGFYYERWGDAPVHSIAASLFLKRDQLHFFEEIGYQHDDWGHCPIPDDIWMQGRCSCSQSNSFDYDRWSSCKPSWDRFINSGR